MILEVFDYEAKAYKKNISPVSVFKTVREKFGAPVALLESALCDENNTFSFVAFEPIQSVISTENSFEKIKKALKQCKKFPKNFHLSGGLIGYFNWEVIEEIVPGGVLDPEKFKTQNHKSQKPKSVFYEFSRFFIFDHQANKVFALKTHFENAENFHSENQEILKISEASKPFTKGEIQDEKNANFEIFQSEQSQSEFMKKVDWAKEKILNGEVFQMIISNGFQVETKLDGIDFYEALRMIEPTTHLFFLDFAEHGQVAGASPEVLGSKRHEKVYYSPIAGTRYRGKTEEEDQKMAEDLRADPKENAEHDMLIDLGRNDLGRVCQTGSLEIKREKYIKKFANLMHMVSDIEGIIQPELDSVDFFRSIFPAGTLSGAPKIRAMNLIRQIENEPRDLYGGAMGYFSADGDMEFCIMIRSFSLQEGLLKFRTGAGIVQDSDPKKEWLEVHNKAKSLCKIINFVEQRKIT